MTTRLSFFHYDRRGLYSAWIVSLALWNSETIFKFIFREHMNLLHVLILLVSFFSTFPPFFLSFFTQSLPPSIHHWATIQSIPHLPNACLPFTILKDLLADSAWLQKDRGGWEGMRFLNASMVRINLKTDAEASCSSGCGESRVGLMEGRCPMMDRDTLH